MSDKSSLPVLVFATQNPNKIKEISQVLRGKVVVRGLAELGQKEELPETGATLRENALQKARFVAEKFNVNCFSDDTGLEVEALNGAPGIYSARYAGEERSPEKNMDKLLAELVGKSSRKACFKTVIALILEGKEHFFEGKVEGVITEKKAGTGGFGYDPVFQPSGESRTFAEMLPGEKNALSHRARAVNKLVEFLSKG